ncbi:sulfate adenylyltransferase [Candidatus Dojkabacteria bacterium]|nr:sulfate adenylyltransferase [Candidatus Dojkabacteria bacterium]
MDKIINPHGGKLVSRIINESKFNEILESIDKLVMLELEDEEVKDVKNIGRGVFSPLNKFIGKEDFKSVIHDMRLKDGTVWPIPIVLDITAKEAEEITDSKIVVLVDKNKRPIGLLEDPEIYEVDKKEYAEGVFGTLSEEHPGVKEVFERDKYMLGGDIYLIESKEELYPEYNLSPVKTRERFNLRAWQKIVAFQTRNVPHRGHEFLQKEALKKVDGLFVQPVIGEKKLRDFKDEYILGSYEILLDKFYPRNKVVLGILPLRMRYAGPREAVLHAIIRQNYGCSHFIVGRDHAGVKDFYKAYEAQEIFENFSKEELAIEILKFPEVVYNKSNKKHCFVDQCPNESQVKFSGSKMREHIEKKEKPPEYILRKEIFDLLTNSRDTMVDPVYKNKNGFQKGFVLWLTGLSQSGKSTLADKVFEKLLERNIRVERLDGDIVRESLTKDLGFTKEDRDENIRRVGFVAKMLARNNIGVIASFISPYKKQRDELRMKIHNFIEVYVNTPIKICEKRDKKGLYAKARKGEIKNFTGISAPYEEPQDPEIEIKTQDLTVEESVDIIVKFLEERRYI